MQAQSPESTDGWVITTLRWLWGADDDVGWRELFTATPATWTLLAIFSAVSISDMVLAGSLHESGPVIERIGQSPAYEALGQVWRFVTTTLINAPETEPPVNALQHLVGNAVPLRPHGAASRKSGRRTQGGRALCGGDDLRCRRHLRRGRRSIGCLAVVRRTPCTPSSAAPSSSRSFGDAVRAATRSSSVWRSRY